MEERIHEIAGYIEDYLEWAEEDSVTAVADAIEVPSNKVLMGLGLLAGQGRIEFIEQDRGHYVTLSE